MFTRLSLEVLLNLLFNVIGAGAHSTKNHKIISFSHFHRIETEEVKIILILTLTLLHKICSMCGFPLSNIWHGFFFKKTSDEQLILKAIIFQNRSVTNLCKWKDTTKQK